MDQKLASLLSMLCFLTILSACSNTAPVKTPVSQSPTSTTSSTTSFPLGCQPDSFLLDNLKAQLPYELVEIIFQAYAGENTLVIWFADPDLGTAYTAENEIIATEKAVQAAQTLDAASVCIQKYDLLYVTVVSVDYTQWFSGALRPEDLLDAESAASGGNPQGERGSGVTAMTAAPPDLPRESDCDFQTAQAAVHQTGADLGVQIGITYVRDENGDNLFLHWTAPTGTAAEDSLSILEDFTTELSCLYPRPTGLSITVADQDGEIQLTGFLPVNATRRKAEFDLDLLSYQLLDGE